MDTIRPLPMFLGITGPSFCFSPEAFNPPSKKLDKSTGEKIKNRLKLNFSFFISNYAFITVGTSIVVALMNTEMILYVALVSTFWWFHTFTLQNRIPITIGGKNLDGWVSVRTRSNILMAMTIIVVIFYCLVPVLSMISISGILILAHALLRDPKHIESSSVFRRGSESDDENEDDVDTDGSGSEVMVDKGDIC